MGKRLLSGASARALFASVLASACTFVAPAMAQAPPASAPSVEMAFDIEAQPLSSALTEFARQAGVRVLYPYEELSRVQAQGVRGRFSANEALTRLLANSGYRATIENGTLSLEPTRPQYANGAEDEIVVTGSRIRGVAPAGANVITIDRSQIDESGRATLQDVIQTLPQNFAGSQNEATQEGTLNARSNFTFASTVDLRGLGADATLTLVNGRRLAPSGVGNFVDISAIPLSAVERIEVLADGASAAYGSDNPHTHIVLRGNHVDGRDLILPKEFVQHGFRNAARDAATARLGERTRSDEREALEREAITHGPTRLDYVIANQLDQRRQIRLAKLEAPNRSPDMTDALKARSRELMRLGLAHEVKRNVLQFEPGWRDALKAMELHLDIRKALLQARAKEQSQLLVKAALHKQRGLRLPFGLGL
jgi:TonB-dependent Receptor Plug Domain